MIVFPNAKINLGLKITSKNPDGYHDIETVFYPIGISDVLEVIENKDGKLDVFTSSGIEIPGSSKENICLKALAFLRESQEIPALQIHLHKVIPIGAGLGGGSSDAAFFIKAVDKLFSLELSELKQLEIARKCGSDCAFFIKNRAAYAEGRGDELFEIDLRLNGYYLVLLNPGIHISTAEAYSGVKPEKPEYNVKELIGRSNVMDWNGKVENDFERNIFVKYPQIKTIKDLLYQNGALYASMSGSGSSVFGIFKDKPIVPEALAKHVIWEGNFQ